MRQLRRLGHLLYHGNNDRDRSANHEVVRRRYWVGDQTFLKSLVMSPLGTQRVKLQKRLVLKILNGFARHPTAVLAAEVTGETQTPLAQL